MDVSSPKKSNKKRKATAKSAKTAAVKKMDSAKPMTDSDVTDAAGDNSANEESLMSLSGDEQVDSMIESFVTASEGNDSDSDGNDDVTPSRKRKKNAKGISGAKQSAKKAKRQKSKTTK